MVRVKKAVNALKRRRKILKKAKGFRWSRKSKERLAREALLHAGRHAYFGRKQKKRNFRRLWQMKISAASKSSGVSYSVLMGSLKKKNVALDRKVLAEISLNHPEIFTQILETAKQ